jgi:23S rRNA pseudouridine1911/1915/1917 synthase
VREEIPAVLAGERLDKVVALLTGLTRSEVAALVESGGVRVGGRPAATRARKLVAGDVVEVDVPEPADQLGPAPQPAVEVRVVHEDADVIVVDKAAGLVVHPGAGNADGTLVNGLVARFPELVGVGVDPIRPGIVHRLDAGTSGLLVVARTPAAYAALVAQLAARSVTRRYWALVGGAVASPAGRIEGPIGRDPRDPTRMAVVEKGRDAVTGYSVLERWERATLVECQLETGRTHQIRVHLAAIGHPVIGDATYGGPLPDGLERPWLHAHHLAFDHPARGGRVSFDSPLPPDLEAVGGGDL